MDLTHELEAKDIGREAQVLAMAAEGLTDKEISIQLGISVATVDTYWRRIRKRHGAASRTEAVAKGLNLSWSHALTSFREENERLHDDMRHHAAVEEKLRREIETRQINDVGSDDVTGFFEFVWRTRILMAGLGTVIWWAQARDPWTIQWISDSVAQWGYSAARLTEGRSLCDIVFPDDSVAFQAGNLMAARAPDKALERQYRVATATGEARLIQERLMAVQDPIRQETQLIGIQLDLESATQSQGVPKTRD